MRTIRRISLPLNQGKWAELKDITHRYADEKDGHLQSYHVDAYFGSAGSERSRRDVFVRQGYVSPGGLQGRMWKMALKDGRETVDRQWCALAAELKPLIFACEWTDEQKHYAYWLIFTSRRMAQLVSGKAPVYDKLHLDPAARKPVQNYLRRVIRRKRGGRPRVRIARSFALDANMYSLETYNGRQYLKVMGLKQGKRIVIPLTGEAPLTGNIRVVLDDENRRVEVHYSAEVKGVAPLEGETCALDAGITEVFTDEEGTHYGKGFGVFLGQASDELCDKGRKRSKLYRVAEKAKRKGDHAKARRIYKFNLGKKKQRRNSRKRRTELRRRINTAVNQVLKERQPQTIITEKLDIRGKAKSKKLSRRVALWTRSDLNERVEFKASAGGSCRKHVNPAYTSQMCPECGYVHRGNRRGDVFQCLQCGHREHSDRVAARNLKARQNDPEITLFTPKERVKVILLGRFKARLESVSPRMNGVGVTVPGRTPDTRTQPGQSERETTGAILLAGEIAGAKCSQYV